MKTIAVRLADGTDLKQELMRIASEPEIPAGVILSGVGGLKKAHIRFPSTPQAAHSREAEGDLEIVSITGTVSAKGSHVHISFANNEGVTFGGHLLNGCTIRNTVELVIGVLDDVVFSREMDKVSGFEELVIRDAGTQG
jgi:predicted DNA-binding protein with PD1-like motif